MITPIQCSSLPERFSAVLGRETLSLYTHGTLRPFTYLDIQEACLPINIPQTIFEDLPFMPLKVLVTEGLHLGKTTPNMDY